MFQNKQKFIVPALVVFLAFPMIYLFMKSSSAPELPKEQVVATTSPADIGSLEKAVQQDPSFDNLINLSMAYINNQMAGKSIEHLQHAIQLNSNSAIAYNNLGVAYTMLQQYQNGVDACTKAMQLDTTFQLAKNNFNWANGERNKVMASIAAQEKIPANKRDAAFGLEYGLNYFKIGNYDKSIEIWTAIAEKDMKNTQALNNIGTAFMMKNQIEDAIMMFKKVLDVDGNNQLAKNNMTWALTERDKAVQKK